jgi:hypothetical protein
MERKPKESLGVVTTRVRRTIFERLRGHLRAPQSSQLAAQREWSATRPRQVKERGQIGKGQYVIFEDGAVEVATPHGTRRFKDVQELISMAKSLRSVNSVGSSD